MNQKSYKEYGLSEEIIKALEILGYETPTKVQEKVIPLALEKRDLLVQSQTGSGKTAAYAIPICQQIEWLENKPQAMVITPTRELAVQVRQDFVNIGRFKRIKAAAVYGRHSFAVQKNELKQKSHVVAGTPGRLLDHIERGTISLEKINCLVIDEADIMLNMGFMDQVKAIIDKLPKNRVTMLFSATLLEEIKNLAALYMKNSENVEIQDSGITTAGIEHVLYRAEEMDKLSLLHGVCVIENPDSCIIFCRTKERVEMVWGFLKNLRYQCDKLHGALEQDKRFEVMDRFRRGEFRYLVATDLAARGIDIENITHIINYDIPYDKEVYVHRTGRTGRAGFEGKAITFAVPSEERYLSQIEEYIGFPLTEQKTPEKEEVDRKITDFMEKMKAAPAIKKMKGERLNRQIMKLYFSGGKKKKLRAVDFVGTIGKIDGITHEDIGIIDIRETVTYVEILNGKGPRVLEAMKDRTVKGKQLKVSAAEKKRG